MPHIIIEHTANLDLFPYEEILSGVTAALAKHPEVKDEADLKARVVPLETYRVGLKDTHRGFIHITLRILEGRSDAVKDGLSKLIAEEALKTIPSVSADVVAHLSVEVVDMHRASYSKIRLG